MSSFYTEDELKYLGLKQYGKNILISRKASLYDTSNISLGDNVRIDDFCILSGKITLGSHIHISAYVAIYGSKGVVMEDYTGVSPHATIYSAMDDFSGDYLIGPIHDDKYTNVTGGIVRICKYSQVGASSIVFPNLTIEEGVVIGAMSMVKESLECWGIYAGIPVRKIKNRHKLTINI